MSVFVSERLKWFKQENNCFLLSGTDKIIEPQCLSYRFKSILKKAGPPPVKFHSLRPTFATNCLQQNFDIKTLSEILGHSGVNITMRVYVHSSLERKTECMQMLRPVLQNFFKPSNSSSESCPKPHKTELSQKPFLKGVTLGRAFVFIVQFYP